VVKSTVVQKAATASGVNPPDFFDYKIILGSFSSAVRAILTTPDLIKRSSCICSNCGCQFTPYLNITNLNSNSSPISTFLFNHNKCKEIKIPYLPPTLILQEFSKIFIQKPIQIIISPLFSNYFPELWWNMLWGFALLQTDFSWLIDLVQKMPEPAK